MVMATARAASLMGAWVSAGPGSEQGAVGGDHGERVVDANSAWLSELIAARGWPGEALVGQRAAGAAWLFAQHADHRPDFQRECLELLAAAVTAGDAEPQHSALSADRVLAVQGNARSSALS